MWPERHCHFSVEKSVPCSGPMTGNVAFCVASIVEDEDTVLTVLTVQQYRQCTYNVTLRRVHEAIVAVEKQ